MDLLQVSRVVATCCTGVASGMFIGYRMSVPPARPQLAPGAFIGLMQAVRQRASATLPPLLFGALLGTVTWAAILARRGIHGTWPVALAAAGLAATIGVTYVVHLPLEQELQTWRRDTPPTDLDARWAPWERWHRVCAWLLFLAFVLQVVVLAGGGSAWRLRVG
ncbi:MAG TPA: DUF1772 domain-containing protein [Gemmatimonadales bacterium]|nr:DUF1772 domain-containing protein [Gemmatimonadales bacterium]